MGAEWRVFRISCDRDDRRIGGFLGLIFWISGIFISRSKVRKDSRIREIFALGILES